MIRRSQPHVCLVLPAEGEVLESGWEVSVVLEKEEWEQAAWAGGLAGLVWEAVLGRRCCQRMGGNSF